MLWQRRLVLKSTCWARWVRLVAIICIICWGCRSEKAPAERRDPIKPLQIPATASSGLSAAGRPAILYLPGSGLGIVPSAPLEQPRGIWDHALDARRRCPSEMVDIEGEFCVDRYEASLVDRGTRRPLSPYFPPSRGDIQASLERGELLRERAPTALGRSMPIPQPAEYELTGEVTPMAVSLPGELPHGYMSGQTATSACRNAGKRLCTASEWRRACRGQGRSRFPYGNEYRQGACNVFRATHPARVLHADPSLHHLDPRLNLVTDSEGPLLRKTGAVGTCRSAFGSDAVYDMVGNLDEWVAGPPGVFLGGFYSRATREGCDAEISSHAFEYLDYSLGFRCCL